MQNRLEHKVAPELISTLVAYSVIAIVFDKEPIVRDHLLRSGLLDRLTFEPVLCLVILSLPDHAVFVPGRQLFQIHLDDVLVPAVSHQSGNLRDHLRYLRLASLSGHHPFCEPRNVILRLTGIIVPEFLLAYRKIFVRILTLDNRHDTTVQPFLQYQLAVLDHSIDSGIVRVSYYDNRTGLLGNLADLFGGQSRTKRSNGIDRAHFVHTDDIRIAFYKEGGFGCRYLPICLIMSEQLLAFDEYLRLRRIQVLRDMLTFFLLPDKSSGESEDPSGLVRDREYDTFEESVIIASGLGILSYESGCKQGFDLVSGCRQGFHHLIA